MTWVFGYGSLIWRPDFTYVERGPAFVEGWARRYWQGSTDHRGVPESPGRVVTLIREPAAQCWGMAYRVEDAVWNDVVAALDLRESGGYERVGVTLHRQDAPAVEGLLYLATPGNPNYLGPAPLADIAAVVRRSAGPSGANREYALRLAESLREMGAADDHVFAVEELAVSE